MKLNVLALLAALVLVAGATAADARPSRDGDPAAQWNPFVHSASVASGKSSSVNATHEKRRKSYSSRSRSERVRHAYAQPESYSSGRSAGPRPRAWCGWWMRTQRGGGPELNLAWNWSRWGSPASGPQVGAVVVWRHHVGEIVGQAPNGKWLVRSGNDGNAVRTRARSVAGAVFRVG